MTRREENQLVALLKRLYGRHWQFEWRGEEGGFSLRLEVERPQKKVGA